MNRLLTAAVATASLFAAACGGGTAITPPPPAGKFANASLNGTYAFMTSGEVLPTNATSAVPMVRVGSFAADGSGHITSGVEDVNASGTVSNAATITGGSYSINADGRGTLTLNVVSAGFNSSINFSIVLTSGSSGPPSIASSGLMIDETTTGQISTGSGNFIQQTGPFATTTVNGSYVFDFSGLDSAGAPASIIGKFSTSSGSITGGIDDENDNGTLTPMGTVQFPASFTPDSQFPGTLSSSGRGVVTINAETYAFYIVDPTRIRLISIGASGGATPDMLTGDAMLQASVPPAPTGSFAFLVAGSDLNASNGLIRVGRFTVSGNTVSKILLDENDATVENEYTTFTNMTPIINYDPVTGRGVVSFAASSLKMYSFVFYLSSATSGVIQDVSPSGASSVIEVADGSIAAQTGSSFTGSNITGPYVMNWSGLVTANGGIASTDEEDFLSQVTVSNLNLSGTGDIFQFTGLTLTTNFGTGGSINFNGGDGAGDDTKPVFMTVIVGQPHVDMVVYIVSPQLAFFANRDNNGTQRIVAGVMQAQQ